jgi:hydrogenase maturation protease
MRTLVLGLGNPLLGDDAVGLKVAALVRERLGGAPGVDVEEEEAGGLRLMERMTGYDRAILVDAAATAGVMSCRNSRTLSASIATIVTSDGIG